MMRMNFTPEQWVALIASIGSVLVGLAGVIATAVVSVMGQKRSSEDQQTNREANALERAAERDAVRADRAAEWEHELVVSREEAQRASTAEAIRTRREVFEDFLKVANSERHRFRAEQFYDVSEELSVALARVELLSEIVRASARAIVRWLQAGGDGIQEVYVNSQGQPTGGGRSTASFDKLIDEYLARVRIDLGLLEQ